METVLISGSARRIGSIIASDLASAGNFVWIHYHRHEEEAYALCNKIRTAGGQCGCICADLNDTDQIDRMLEGIIGSEHGSLTTLINNASVFEKGTIRNTAPDTWDKVMNTNLKSVWYLSVRFYELFRSTAKRIITIGDASVAGGYAGHAVYGLSKFSLKYLNRQMAEAFAPEIRVNLLSPGLVLQGEAETDESWNERTNRTPVDNSGIAEDLLKAVHFLMSDPGMTGSELVVDNGLHLHGNCKI